MFCVSTVLISATIEFAAATPTFKFAPFPKYAREVSGIPLGLYAVVYPSDQKRPFLMARESNDPEVVSSYRFLLVLASINLFDDNFGEPFLVELDVNQVEWQNTRDGELMKDQLIEIDEIKSSVSGIRRHITYFHPLAKELDNEYCIYRFISGSEKRCN